MTKYLPLIAVATLVFCASVAFGQETPQWKIDNPNWTQDWSKYAEKEPVSLLQPMTEPEERVWRKSRDEALMTTFVMFLCGSVALYYGVKFANRLFQVTIENTSASISRGVARGRSER